MRIIIQKVTHASVTVDAQIIGEIQQGYMLLVGVTHDDTAEDVHYCVRKVANMRLFEDSQGKMNLSLNQVNGEILSVSQFTLYANTAKGNRPSFVEAAKPEVAEQLYNTFNEQLRQLGYTVHTGQFGAMMQVQLTNDGPVTIILDSKQK